ncbi:MAG: 2-oxoacid:acceptor oxidoreductase family protein [candidate division WOR-3 bacterium]|nr:2-oxoacid:acceptor oxidoreductase family protein [candidate division WOR-3 bacterium]
MLEIRIHGRGGQGSVVASKILAYAFAKEGKYVQAFPEFGVERRGAPVTAFLRVSDKPINNRSKIYEPQHLIVLEPTLIAAVDITGGLKPGGYIIINSKREPKDIELDVEDSTIATVDATGIALENRLGSKVSPIVNTAILGSFAKVTGFVKLESVIDAVKDEVPVKPEENAKATKDAFETTIQ